MNVTREMLGAAHDILLKKEIVLSADIISNIYIAMASRDAEISELNESLKLACEIREGATMVEQRLTYWLQLQSEIERLQEVVKSA